MAARLTIRPATEADLPALVALLADDVFGQAREGGPGEPGYAAALRAIAANPEDAQYVAEQQGRVVGCFQLTFLPGLAYRGAWRGQIEGVRIAAGLRGQGLGREMIGWAIERCRARGCLTVQLTSNAKRTDARRFYKSLGFADSHVGMKLDLS